jgi:hypothetical protein
MLKYSCTSQRQLPRFGQMDVCYTIQIASDLCISQLIRIAKPQEEEDRQYHKVIGADRSFSCGWRVAFRVLRQRSDSDRTLQGLDGAP